MTTIYIVTAGVYSDYHIEAVFSSEEQADRYVAAHNTSRWDRYEVQDWVLDKDTVGETVQYRVGINTWSGDTNVTLLDNPVERDDQIQANPNAIFGGNGAWYQTWVEAKDAETARKVGSERWAQVLAGQVPVALWTQESMFGEWTHQRMVVPEKVGGGTVLHSVDGGEDLMVPAKRDYMSRLEPTDTPLLSRLIGTVTFGDYSRDQ